MAAPTPTKVALITGGSSGIGLAVARALAAQGGWQIHLVDLKAPSSAEDGLHFHHADLRDYAALAAVFKAVFVAGGRRLDFVFANAGLFEKVPLYDGQPFIAGAADANDEPPPRPDHAPVEVNLQGTIDTVHLARHFMLRSSAGGGEKGAVVVNGSVGSVWPTSWAPLYTASKFGILGFTRAIAGQYKLIDGIRVNALLPGAVKTPIMDWPDFVPDDMFTPMALVTDIVLNLVAGGEIVDSKGVRVAADKAYGQAVVVTGSKFYVQPEAEYCDAVLGATVESTKVENQVGKGV